MSTDTILRCALGVSDRMLSDFRSDGLSAKEMERLRAHVAECPSCQARLDALEAMARVLRAQPEPDDHAQLWRNVQASIAASPASVASRSHRHIHIGAHSSSTRFWAAFGSIAAVVALSIGFVSLFVSRGGWPPAAKLHATPTADLTGSLTWRRIIVPNRFPGVGQFKEDNALGYTGVQIAQSDGKIAYACQADRKYVTSPVVWATYDAGAHWSVITPVNLPTNTGGCLLKVDTNDANTVTVSFIPVGTSGQLGLPDSWTTYATFDGGATWSKPAGLQDGNVNYLLATARGKVYATRGIATPDGHVNIGLYVSRDQMRTWTRIDATLSGTRPDPSQDRYTFQFWVNASTGEVLNLMVQGSLLSTRDDGAYWTEIAYPEGVFTAAPHSPSLVVGTPTTSGFLTICGSFTPIEPANEQWLECTTNDGRTWNKRPSNTIVASTYDLSPVGIGADGSIYAVGSWSPANTALEFYRLPLTATTTNGWQRLGAVPDSRNGGSYVVAPSGSSMILWTLPTIGMTTDSKGNTTTKMQPNYYVAVYP